jgi:hypothetical protein
MPDWASADGAFVIYGAIIAIIGGIVGGIIERKLARKERERERTGDRLREQEETRLILVNEMSSNQELALEWRRDLSKWAGADLEQPFRVTSMDGVFEFVTTGGPPFSTTVWNQLTDRAADAYGHRIVGVFAHYSLVKEISSGFERLTRMREMQDFKNPIFTRHGADVASEILRKLDELSKQPIPG